MNPRAIVNSKKKFPKRECAYRLCEVMFWPVVEHQKFCRTSHSVLECQARKFDRAVEAEVERRLKEILPAGTAGE